MFCAFAAKVKKVAQYLCHVSQSVSAFICLSASNNLRRAERIFVIPGTEKLTKNNRHSPARLKSNNNSNNNNNNNNNNNRNFT
jgi:hypothetical protein